MSHVGSGRSWRWRGWAIVGIALLLCSCNGSDNNSSSTTTPSGPNPAPTLSSVTPDTAATGATPVTVTASGSNFVSDSTIQVNGTSLPTTFVSASSLQAQIPASDLGTPGSVTISVTTPSPGGGTSGSLNFTVGYSVVIVNQAANDLVWDPVNQVIYLAVPSTAAQGGNTISVLDPSTGTIVGSQFAGSEPTRLALASDSSYVYTGLNGSDSVARFVLPALTPDITIALGSGTFGPYFALDLQAAPGSPHTIAVSRGVSGESPAAEGGVVIYDDATARPTIARGFGSGGGGAALYDVLQWGSDASVLFAANTEDTGFDFYVLGVTTSGVTPLVDYPDLVPSFGNNIHYDPGTFGIYTDAGQVIDPANGTQAGVFQASGKMVPDSSVGKAFFLISQSIGATSQPYTIESFDINKFTQIASITIPNVTGTPGRLIRWGPSGLAFATSQAVYLISGDFVH